MNSDAVFLEACHLHDKLVDAESKDEVLAIMNGASVGAFMELDSRPGQFYGNYANENWYMWLRQLRNDKNSGLLERLG